MFTSEILVDVAKAYVKIITKEKIKKSTAAQVLPNNAKTNGPRPTPFTDFIIEIPSSESSSAILHGPKLS